AFYAGAEGGGTSGGYVSLNYDQTDNGCGPAFGQLFTPPQGADGTQGLVWYGSDSVKVSFDVKIRDAAGNTNKWRGDMTLHWSENDIEKQHTTNAIVQGYGSGLGANYTWERFTYDFKDVAKGFPIVSLFISLNGIPSSWTPIIAVDNFVMKGANLGPALTFDNTANDGYANFIVPYGTSGIASTVEGASQSLTTLAGGKAGYVYEVGVMDYTGINPVQIDMVSKAHTFRLLDENTGLGGSVSTKNAFETTGLVGNGQIFSFLQSDGSVSKDVLIVADKNAINPDSIGANLGAFPWLFTDVAPDDLYTNTYGELVQPATGYYSPARNSVISTGLADGMDYAMEPLGLSGSVGYAMNAASTLTLTCPAQTPLVTCSADPNPDMKVTFSSASRVIENVVVELVSAADDSVIGSAVIPATGGSAIITISDDAMAAMAALGDDHVYARTAGGVFAEEATTGLFFLDNFAPTAGITGSTTGLVKGSSVTLHSNSTDADGTITRNDWLVTFLSDPTPDGDYDVASTVRAIDSPDVTFTIPDDGVFKAVLTVTDDGGATATAEVGFEANNRAPTLSISGPAVAKPGVPLAFTFATADADDFVNYVEVDDGSGFVPVNTALRAFTATFAAGPTGTVQVRVNDTDGAIVSASKTIIVDGDAPTTTLTNATTPASGWFTGPTTFSVTRADTGGSGVASTTVIVDGVTSIVSGSANFTRTLTGDGEHDVTVFTTDKAGNVGLPVSHHFKIDGSAPTVAITAPSQLPGPISGVFKSGSNVTLEADALDSQSAVTSVKFFVDGISIGSDTDGTDGWTAVWTPSGTGFQTLDAIATNGSDLTGSAKTLTVLVWSSP
ncbi:MAG: Ig-like domain-containing protein, partial [Candidatus Thermoplasmatota archaeon]